MQAIVIGAVLHHPLRGSHPDYAAKIKGHQLLFFW